jgi:type IV pilus assembly protein PilB
MTLLETLAERKLISKKDIPGIQKELAVEGATFDEVLRRHGIADQDIIRAKADVFEVPTRAIGNADEIPYSTLEFIPEESANHYKFAPLGVKDGVLEVGLVDPDNIEARDALNFISAKIGMPYKIYLISDQDFEKVISAYKGLSAEVTNALTELETELKSSNIAQGKEEKDESEKLDLKEGKDLKGAKGDVKKEAKIVEDAPVTKIVATILRYATEGNASDIHIEPMRENVRVRFRVDGILNTSLVLADESRFRSDGSHQNSLQYAP